ncbi:tRNA pseudouridine(13) synthase TruD [Thiorhodovibrio winogradskyi]|nr:tRNA pseudouridine(13) synthase TruD [Thiorhodovibrio winogradskyi]
MESQIIAPELERLIGFEQLPRAHGLALIKGLMRAHLEDFRVAETLSFEPDDQGAHWLLQVRKTGANTEWVARRLAALTGVAVRDIGYAGLKDRQAVATQWFSLPLGEGPVPDWSPLAAEGMEVLACRRHGRKLRRGAIAWNSFELRLRELSGDLDALPARLSAMAAGGVPNYFGPQRFGRDAGNLARAHHLLSARPGRGQRLSRYQRGLLLSAARSALFNQVLARRVELECWNQALPGERLQLAGSHSHFLAEVIDDSITNRVTSGDLSPTGPLCGTGDSLVDGELAALEIEILAPWADWIDGLGRAGLRAERRALILRPLDLDWEMEEGACLRLTFRLPAGAYATSVVRELGDWWEPAGGGTGARAAADSSDSGKAVAAPGAGIE